MVPATSNLIHLFLRSPLCKELVLTILPIFFCMTSMCLFSTAKSKSSSQAFIRIKTHCNAFYVVNQQYQDSSVPVYSQKGACPQEVTDVVPGGQLVKCLHHLQEVFQLPGGFMDGKKCCIWCWEFKCLKRLNVSAISWHCCSGIRTYHGRSWSCVDWLIKALKKYPGIQLVKGKICQWKSCIFLINTLINIWPDVKWNYLIWKSPNTCRSIEHSYLMARCFDFSLWFCTTKMMAAAAMREVANRRKILLLIVTGIVSKRKGLWRDLGWTLGFNISQRTIIQRHGFHCSAHNA